MKQRKRIAFLFMILLAAASQARPMAAQRQIPPADTAWLPDRAGYVVRGGPRHAYPGKGIDSLPDYIVQMLTDARARIPDSLLNDSLTENAAWQSFPKSWVALCPTDTGYVEYDPCSIGDYAIKLYGDVLLLWMESEPHVFFLTDARQIVTGFQIAATAPVQPITFSKLAKPKGAYLVELFDWDLVMVPAEDRYRFPYVKLGCPKNRLHEILDYEPDYSQIEFE